MSWFPIPLDAKNTGNKRMKLASDERIPKPKVHTVKKLKETQRYLKGQELTKLRLCAKILNEVMLGKFNSEELAWIGLTEAGIFDSMLDARCFIKQYKDKIIEYASNKKETGILDL